MNDRKSTALAFNEELIGLIRKHYPGALKGDIEQNSACASDMSVALGGILAFAFRLNGAVAGRSVLQIICQRIVENATAIDKNAGDMIRKELPNLTLN
jgi:hypothetical protein